MKAITWPSEAGFILRREQLYVEKKKHWVRRKVLELRPVRHLCCQQPAALLGHYVK